VKLDPSLTGVAEPQEWHTIAARHRFWMLDERDAGASANPDLDHDSSAIEAPTIFRRAGWYYLFVSWDRCCSGEYSTYKVVVGRSRAVQGPYLDREGEDLDWGGGSLVVHGFGEDSERWYAGGHNDARIRPGQECSTRQHRCMMYHPWCKVYQKVVRNVSGRHAGQRGRRYRFKLRNRARETCRAGVERREWLVRRRERRPRACDGS
jgi:hypothetical protein